MANTETLRAKPLFFSKCTNQPVGSDELIRYIYDSDKLILIHNNVWFNCATERIKPSLKRVGELIRIDENPVLRSLAACECYYTIIYEITGIKPGLTKFELPSLHYGQSTFQFEINLSKPISGSVQVIRTPTAIPSTPQH